MDGLNQKVRILLLNVNIEGNWWKPQHIQTIFPAPNLKYFPVRIPCSIDISTVNVLVEQALKTAAENDQKEILRNNNIVSDSANERITPWMNRGGWLNLLAGKDMSELYSLTSARVNENNEGFERIQKAVPELIKNCLEGIMDLDKRGWSILRFWLNSTKVGEADQKPFQLYYDKGTIKRYSEYWLRLILFTLRTFDLNNEDDGVKYTLIQCKVLCELRKLITDEKCTDEELYSKLLQLSRVLIDHDDFSTKGPSVIKYFCSIMAWDSATERWRQPGSYTPFLAAIQFCIRVLACEIILPSTRRDKYCEGDLMCETPLELLQRYRQKWLVEGSPYPFNWVHSLMIYGLHIAAHEKSEDKIRFSSDDKYIYWQGRELEIMSWRRFPGDILHTAEKILSRELLFQDKDTIDGINPYKIIDNQSCKDNKYFFGNHMPEYSEKARRTLIGNLGDRVQDMITDEDGHMRWEDMFVKQYAVAQNKFLEYMLIALNTVGGLTGRGTEMLSLLYRNTSTTDRHMMIQDGQVVVATQYHKSQNVMDAIKVLQIGVCGLMIRLWNGFILGSSPS